MSGFVLQLFCLVAISSIATAKEVTVEYTQSECFRTVTHYYSNPQVGGKSILYYTYYDDPRNISFSLSCPDLAIHLEAIKLSIPASMDEFCPDSDHTNFTTCKDSAHCDCCDYPDSMCTVDINNIEYNRNKCDGKKQCVINVTSSFLTDCGMKYHESHSRWAEVHFTCGLKSPLPKETSTSTQDRMESGSLSGLMITAILNIFILAASFAICVWKSKRNRNLKRKEYGQVSKTEFPDQQTSETCLIDDDTPDISQCKRDLSTFELRPCIVKDDLEQGETVITPDGADTSMNSEFNDTPDNTRGAVRKRKTDGLHTSPPRYMQQNSDTHEKSSNTHKLSKTE